MNERVETKEELVFQDNFIPKIKQGIKTKTIRNSPVTLGAKKISDDVSVDVYRVGRVKERTIQCVNSYAYQFREWNPNENTYNETFWMTSEIAFGFDSIEEMYNYYNSYLKSDTAYLIHFRVIGEA
jgi:hypothetical protein